MSRVVAIVIVLSTAVLTVPATPSVAADPLQPGDYVRTSIGACTLGFVFTGAGGSNSGRTYFATAAHCVRRVGEQVRDEAGAAFGRVALIGSGSRSADDYAFIEVFSSHAWRVRAAVKGRSSAPKGYTTSPRTASLSQVWISGYGVGFDLTPTTREQRVGVLVSDDAAVYRLIGPDIYGDSGGPIVYQPTRQALGLVSRLCVGVCTSEGPTIQGILARASARGFYVRLRSV